MPLQNQDSYNTPKDFFIYLLSIITLYIFFSSFIALLFKFVNIYFPAQFTSYWESSIQSVRWHIATIIITFPVYIYTLISIRTNYLRYPEKRNLKVRKWLLYFTLFVAAVIIMGDLGTLLYYFLGGDITARFLLKTLIILVMVATLFLYYIRELHSGWHSKQSLIWLISFTITVFLALIYGFYLIGSPAKARKDLIDQHRIQDLTSIQNELLRYWQQKKQLPASLSALINPFTGYKVPQDPITNVPYFYRTLSPYTFELCATFYAPSQGNSPYYVMGNTSLNWNWLHPAGYYCFQRTIDPELYKK